MLGLSPLLDGMIWDPAASVKAIGFLLSEILFLSETTFVN
jgi:hypothetical protein